MKKYFLLLATMFSFGAAMAQLTVESSGNVHLNKTLAIGTPVDTCINLNIYRESKTTLPIYGIKSHVLANTIAPTGSMYGVYSYVDASSTTAQPSSLSRIIGVTGLAMSSYTAGSRFMAGVVGVANSNRGVGVYGAISSSTSYTLPNSWTAASYAGYFAGTVRVTGTLMAAAVTTTSDYRLKTDIQDIQASSANKILNLRPVSYKFNPSDSTNYVYFDNAKEMQVHHYGLIAQEVQDILPDVVYESGDGYLSINYTELIPLLISTLQEQHQQIEELRSALNDQSVTSKKRLSANMSIGAELYQNTPNPFTQDTRIAYDLPLDTRDAVLYIYDVNGIQKESYPISEFGHNSITISGGHLEAGIYLYSLVADGQAIDTKRMILTK